MAKITIKVKGSPKGALKAVQQIAAGPASPILREADFKTANKKKIVI